MSGLDIAYLSVVGLTVVVMLFLAENVWSQRTSPGAVPFALMALTIAEIASTFILFAMTASPTLAFTWERLRFLGLASLPVLYFMFVAHYTGRREWTSGAASVGLWIVPMLTQIVIWIAPQPLFFSSWNLVRLDNFSLEDSAFTGWFWVHFLYSNLLILAAIVQLIYYFLRIDSSARTRGVLVIAGTVFGLLGAELARTLGPPPGLRLTPLGLGIMGLVLSVLTVRYRLFSIIPIAYDTIFKNMTDGVLVLNEQGEIIQINPVAEQLLQKSPAQLVGEKIKDVLASSSELVEKYAGVMEAQFEFSVQRDGKSSVYDIRVSPLRRRNRFVGRLVVVHDITARKQAETTLAHHNNALQALHETVADIGTELNTNALLNRILDRASHLLNADRGGGIYLYEADNCVLRLTAGSGINSGRVGITLQPSKGVSGRVFRTAQPVIVNDYSHWEEHGVILVEAPPSAVMGVPLFIQDHLVGALVLTADSSRRIFSEQDVRLAEMFATYAGVALQNAQLYEQAQREITERKEAEAKFQNLFEIAPDGNIITDTEGRIILVNAQIEHSFRTTRAELIGQPIERLLPEQFRAGHIQHRANYYGFPRKRPMGASLDLMAERQDGSRFPVEVSLSPLQTPDGLLVMAIIRDISERKQAAERLASERNLLRILIDNLPDFVYVKDTQSRFVINNIAHARSMGTTPENVIGKTDFDFYPREMAARFSDDEQTLFQTGAPLIGREEPSLAEDGTQMWALTTKVPLRDADGKIIGLVGVTRNITARKSMEEELAKARDQAIEASRLKSVFLATMSHEIRTPMNGIIGMLDLLTATSLTAQQREMLDIMRSSGQTLMVLINDILDFSKIEAGRLTLETIDFEPLATLENVTSLFAAQARARQLQFEIQADPNIPLVLRGDPTRLQQVLLNLIGNAVKFTKHGSIHVQMTLEQMTDTYVLVHFAVIDTGIGFSEATRRRLFQPFTQGDSSTTRQYGGTGLGLAICQRLIELMKGELIAESQEGQGSTFSFTIPLSIPDASIPRQVRVVPRDLHAMNVLVVDDDAIIGELVGHYLQQWNARYVAVRSGEEALTQLRMRSLSNNAFNAAIIDLMMPGLNGMTLCKTVKDDKTLNATRLIALTARRDTALLDEARNAGFVTCLTKPINVDELYQVLGQASPTFTKNVIDSVAVSDVPILLVEDNPTNQYVISLQLQRLGYEVGIVDSGQAALDMLAQNQKYGLVLMDCQMPEMDGFETTRHIRRVEAGSNKHIPIIALTANAVQGDRDAALAAGMDDYIAKPVSLSDLAHIIRRWIVMSGQNTSQLAATPLAASLASEKAPILDGTKLDDLRDLGAPGNPGFLKELVNSFLTDSTELLIMLREAIEKEDAKEAFRAAHTLKSSSAMYGAQRLANLFKQLEKAMRAADFADSRAQLKTIEAEYQQVKEALISEADKG